MLLAQLEIIHASVPAAKPQTIVQTEICITSQLGWSLGVTVKLGRVQLKCDGTQWRMGGEVKGKLANRLGIQYSSHHLGTWCIQHYYR
jgi:hypothetical protein